jgi:uncharacterized protein (DUF2141 family)
MLSARLLLPFLALPLVAASGAPIEVAVTNVTQARGRIHVDVCVEKQFVTSDCAYVAEAPATMGTTIVTVPNVPPGRYAVQVFHDRNSDGHVNRGLFGIPKEPIGFSRDAPTPMRAPHFADAAFDHDSTTQRITLRLRSFL